MALYCKAAPGANSALAAEDPGKFFLPAYLGPKGWVGVWLDVGQMDWGRIEALLLDSYRLVAPKRLASTIAPNA